MKKVPKALIDPASEFNSPHDVVTAKEFSREEKIKILRNWEYDAREIEVAEEENMSSEAPDILDKVLQALHELGAQINIDDASPTKQGGE